MGGDCATRLKVFAAIEQRDIHHQHLCHAGCATRFIPPQVNPLWRLCFKQTPRRARLERERHEADAAPGDVTFSSPVAQQRTAHAPDLVALHLDTVFAQNYFGQLACENRCSKTTLGDET